jgi:hypothetical protein
MALPSTEVGVLEVFPSATSLLPIVAADATCADEVVAETAAVASGPLLPSLSPPHEAARIVTVTVVVSHLTCGQ